MWRISAAYAVSVLLIGALSGCGEKLPEPPKLPDTVPYSGVVKLDGKPLAGASVTFLATVDKGLNARGITDASGKYELKTSQGKQEKSGAAAGNYKVQISRFLTPGGEPQDPTKPAEIPGRESLPLRYSSPTDTQLTATVAAGGSKDFDLKSK